MIAQKADQLIGLAAARAEMHIGNKKSTELGRAVLVSHRHDSRDFVAFESASKCVALQNHDNASRQWLMRWSTKMPPADCLKGACAATNQMFHKFELSQVCHGAELNVAR
jgi:nitric oxide synthase oxygenase domain/subunit